MSFKKLMTILFITVAIMCPLTINAQDSTDSDEDSGLGEMFQELGKTAIQGYFGPAITFFGTGMNSGWYNSSKPYSFIGLPVGISVATVSVPFVVMSDNMRYFDFAGKLPIKGLLKSAIPVSIDTLEAVVLAAFPNDTTLGFEDETFFKIDSVPTIFGDDSTRKVTISDFLTDTSGTETKTLLTIKKYNELMNQVAQSTGTSADTIPLDNEIELPFVGGNAADILPAGLNPTSITVGVSKIPVVDNMTIGIRFLTPNWLDEDLEEEFGEIKLFGFMLQHNFDHLIPIIGSLPFVNTSAYYAVNNLTMDKDILKISQNNWIAMINTSVDIKALIAGAGVFMGVGVEGSSLNLDLDMSEIEGIDDIRLTINGDNHFRFQIGSRVSLGIFDVYADINYGYVTSYNAGITILGLNGL